MMRLARRGFLGVTLGVLGSPILGRASAGAKPLVIVDPTARASLAPLETGATVRELAGDPVRFARGITDPPARIIGVTRYADYLILTGSLAERGYRADRTEFGRFVSWTMVRRGA